MVQLLLNTLGVITRYEPGEECSEQTADATHNGRPSQCSTKDSSGSNYRSGSNCSTNVNESADETADSPEGEGRR